MSKTAKKVTLPKEENNGIANKGQDPKDESSSTPDKEEERTEIPEFFARSKESFFYDEKEETIIRMQEKIDEYERQMLIANETIKEQENDKIETIKRITETLPATPGPNMMRPRTPRAQDIAYKAIIEATAREKGKDKPKTNPRQTHNKSRHSKSSQIQRRRYKMGKLVQTAKSLPPS